MTVLCRYENELSVCDSSVVFATKINLRHEKRHMQSLPCGAFSSVKQGCLQAGKAGGRKCRVVADTLDS